MGWTGCATAGCTAPGATFRPADYDRELPSDRSLGDFEAALHGAVHASPAPPGPGLSPTPGHRSHHPRPAHRRPRAAGPLRPLAGPAPARELAQAGRLGPTVRRHLGISGGGPIPTTPRHQAQPEIAVEEPDRRAAQPATPANQDQIGGRASRPGSTMDRGSFSVIRLILGASVNSCRPYAQACLGSCDPSHGMWFIPLGFLRVTTTVR